MNSRLTGKEFASSVEQYLGGAYKTEWVEWIQGRIFISPVSDYDPRGAARFGSELIQLADKIKQPNSIGKSREYMRSFMKGAHDHNVYVASDLEYRERHRLPSPKEDAADELKLLDRIMIAYGVDGAQELYDHDMDSPATRKLKEQLRDIMTARMPDGWS